MALVRVVVRRLRTKPSARRHEPAESFSVPSQNEHLNEMISQHF